MSIFLKARGNDTAPSRNDLEAARQNRRRLDFSKIENDIPELSQRVVLLRSRVKELSYNFDNDATKAFIFFLFFTIGTTLLGTILLIVGLAFSFRISSEGTTALSSLLIVIGSVFASLASAANAFGAGKQYSALITAKWAMKALELNIDQALHEFALNMEERRKLTQDENEKLQALTASWLAIFTNTLTSFGSNYGTSFGAIDLPKLQLSK